MQDHAVVSEQLGCMMRMQSISIQQMDNMQRQLVAGACQQLNTQDGQIHRGFSGDLPSDDDPCAEGAVRTQESEGGLEDVFIQHDTKRAMNMSPKDVQELAAWVCLSATVLANVNSDNVSNVYYTMNICKSEYV